MMSFFIKNRKLNLLENKIEGTPHTSSSCSKFNIETSTSN
jgi:hypothetical protein